MRVGGYLPPKKGRRASKRALAVDENIDEAELEAAAAHFAEPEASMKNLLAVLGHRYVHDLHLCFASRCQRCVMLSSTHALHPHMQTFISCICVVLAVGSATQW